MSAARRRQLAPPATVVVRLTLRVRAGGVEAAAATADGDAAMADAGGVTTAAAAAADGDAAMADADEAGGAAAAPQLRLSCASAAP